MGEILINRIFNGKYAKDENNIGHEIINLFKADNGSHYLYIVDSGAIAMEHNDNIDSILFVRGVGNSMLEVLAKATNLTQKAYMCSHSKNEIKRIHNEQIKTINSVTYGGIPLNKILSNNIYNGNYDGDYAIYYTFTSDNMRRPIKPLYISDKQSKNIDNVIVLNGNLARQSQKQYFQENTDQNSDYCKLNKMIYNSDFWEENDSFEKVDVSKHSKENDYFMKIIKKEYDELAYSNMLSYFFSHYRDKFVLFCKEIFGVDLSKNFQISREEHDIDILIQDNKNVIVIENKIKSGINGIRHDVYSNQVQSQLEKYYDYAKDISNGRNVLCYIFAPNYNRLNITDYKSGKHYKIINYKAILDFYLNNSINDPYYNDLLFALKKHSKTVDDELSEIMLQKFLNAIDNIEK